MSKAILEAVEKISQNFEAKLAKAANENAELKERIEHLEALRKGPGRTAPSASWVTAGRSA
jgi:hypothetical protein